MPLQICMVTTFYPPYNFGGDGIFVYRLTNALARAGHDVHVLFDEDAFSFLGGDVDDLRHYPNHKNVTLHRLSSRIASIDMVAIHQLGRPVRKHGAIQAYLDEHSFDVIHYHNVSLLGGPGVLTYGDGVKLATLHDYWFICAMHVLWRYDDAACTSRDCLTCTLKSKRPPQMWRYTDKMPRNTRHVDAFIAPSQFASDKHYEHGFPHPIHVFPHFVPNEYQALEAAPLPFELPDEFFLYAGRLEKIKGIHHLIELFREYDKLPLVIAGSGTFEQELRTMASDLPHVQFLGFCDNNQLIALYQKALSVIVPSICFETFGWVPLESFSQKTPAIVRNYGALPEVAATLGALVYDIQDELIDHMELLRTNPEERKRIGQQGYQAVLDLYSEQNYVTSYEAFVKKISKEQSL